MCFMLYGTGEDNKGRDKERSFPLIKLQRKYNSTEVFESIQHQLRVIFGY